MCISVRLVLKTNFALILGFTIDYELIECLVLRNIIDLSIFVMSQQKLIFCIFGSINTILFVYGLSK